VWRFIPQGWKPCPNISASAGTAVIETSNGTAVIETSTGTAVIEASTGTAVIEASTGTAKIILLTSRTTSGDQTVAILSFFN